MGEFDLIEKYFRPLAGGSNEAMGLLDDVAVTEKNSFVITKDLIVSGTHFLPKDPLDLVARKLIRVNLSDLAAKGAKPYAYFLGCVWPLSTKESQIADFARGLEEDQRAFGLTLLGGDTTMHSAKAAPLVLSVTMLGTPPKRGIVRRDGGQAGDDLYVSGTIGDSGLGLAVLKKQIKMTPVDKASLSNRYHLPTPRLTLGSALAGMATAALDVSDGLIADAGKLAAASGLGAEIEASALPRSTAAASWIATQDNRWQALATIASFGDDYEILFSAPPSMRRSVMVASSAAKTDVTRIGTLVKAAGIRLVKDQGEEIKVPAPGYDHFG